MFAIIAAAVLWGTTGTAATLLPGSVSPLTTGAATMGIGGLLLMATAPGGTARVLTGGTRWWRWLAPGGLCVAVYPLAFYTSMSMAGVAIGNVVSLGTAPVFAAVVELLLDPPGRRQPLRGRWLCSAAAAVAGVALLALFGHHGDSPAHAGAGTTAAGVGFGLLAGLTYAGYTYTAGRLMLAGAPPRGTVAAQFGVGGVVLLPVLAATGAPLLGPAVTAATPLGDVLGPVLPLVVVGYLAAGPMCLAYLLFGHGLRTVPSSRATTVTLLEPFVATLLAVVAVGERLGPLGWFGLVLVLAGVVSVATDRSRPAHS